MPLVYDRPTGLVLLGGWADHQRLAAQLFQFRGVTAEERPDWRALKHDLLDAGEIFSLAEKFTAERQAFRDYTIERV